MRVYKSIHETKADYPVFHRVFCDCELAPGYRSFQQMRLKLKQKVAAGND